MWRKTVGLLGILAMSVGLTGCQERYEWRQKMTVIVDTPYGERSGSSVTEVVAHYGRLPLSGNEVNYELRGEAVVVEVLPGRFLFALLDEHTNELAASVWKDSLPPRRQDWLRAIKNLGGERSVPVELYPLLVTFIDASNPESITQVESDNIGVYFGNNVYIKSINIEITKDAIANGVVYGVLPWFQSAQVIVPYERKPRADARRPVDNVSKLNFVSR